MNFVDQQKNQRTRCFVAINFPHVLVAELDHLSHQLRQKNSSRAIRYVDSKVMHLTLQFLGEIDQLSLEKTVIVLSEIVPHYPPLALEILPEIDFFPNQFRPQVMYLKLRGDDLIFDLQQEINDALTLEGLALDKKAFRLHLTLARIKDKISPLALPKFGFSHGPFVARRVDLMKSRLTPAGPIHTPLKTFSFANKV